MFNILKADYKKFFRGKLFIALVILIISFPLLSGLLYGFVNANISGEELIPMVTAGSVFMSSFSPLNNVGLILLIFILITLMADFNQNTIRNKVVAGYSKNKVYLSSTIFTLSIAIISTTIYSFLSYLFTGLFIGFGDGDLNVIIKYWIVGIFATMAIYAFVQCVAFVFKSFGASLGLVLGLFFIIFLVYTILYETMSANTNRIIAILIPILHLSGLPIKEADIIWMLLSSGTLTGVSILLGASLNNKLDYR